MISFTIMSFDGVIVLSTFYNKMLNFPVVYKWKAYIQFQLLLYNEMKCVVMFLCGPFISLWCQDLECVELYFCAPRSFHGVVFKTSQFYSYLVSCKYHQP
jgi:hypothetical protein